MALSSLEQDKPIYSISEINSEVKRLIEDQFSSVWVRGEISNFKRYPSGHCYFTLKDEGSQISAVMFRGMRDRLKFDPEDGMEVIVQGHLSLYEPQGRYQLLVHHMQPEGLGSLQMAFEKLKAKLQDKGYFDDSEKKELPKFPQKIGVVTSEAGAAIHDIITVLKRRWPSIQITLYPAQVQGEGSAEDIANGIAHFNDRHPVDVMIVGRGGGSLEDLWSFNTEVVADAIHKSKIPVVSAVGHETDFSIADFVADVRAPTPSAAAEVCVPDAREWYRSVQVYRKTLIHSLHGLLQDHHERVKYFVRLIPSPQKSWEYFQLRISDLEQRLCKEIVSLLNEKKRVTSHAKHALQLLSPEHVLKRGYVIVQDLNEKVVTSSKTLKTNQELDLHFAEGRARVQVKEKSI